MGFKRGEGICPFLEPLRRELNVFYSHYFLEQYGTSVRWRQWHFVFSLSTWLDINFTQSSYLQEVVFFFYFYRLQQSDLQVNYLIHVISDLNLTWFWFNHTIWSFGAWSTICINNTKTDMIRDKWLKLPVDCNLCNSAKLMTRKQWTQWLMRVNHGQDKSFAIIIVHQRFGGILQFIANGWVSLFQKSSFKLSRLIGQNILLILIE